jgi:hypothetical protein
MTISDGACALIGPAAGCAAAQILEDKEAIVSSHAGRMAVPRINQSVHDVYVSLGGSYFQPAHQMTYKLFWKICAKLAS